MKYKCPKCGEDFSSAVFGYFIPDEAVVSRFNELWKSQKVECCAHSDCHLDWFYRLRPTPRYRPFTAVEAAGQLGRVVRLREGLPSLCEWNDWSITYDKSWGYSITVGSSALSPNDAKDNLFFTDTGEPFGVKE